MRTKKKMQWLTGSVGSIALAAALMSSPSLAQNAWDAEDFDLDALVEAAKAEPPITVYAITGKIVDTAEAFTEKYGIEATGTKASGAEQVELMLRESQAGNIIGDLGISGDAAASLAQLMPLEVVDSWVPPDMMETIPENARDPLAVVADPSVFTYNTEVNESCPVSNIWELTEPEWNRRFAMPDPLNKPAYVDWFNQMESHWDEEMAQAYEDHFGEALDTSERSATAAWVIALAENEPLVTDSDSAVGDAVGAPGQSDPFFGLMSTAKYRVENLHLGICDGMQPFAGWSYPSYGLIAAGTDSPNAARLFLHYLMTEEGISPQSIDGKVSGNTAVPAHPEEVSGVNDVIDQIMTYNASTGLDDFDYRQDWQDLWRINYTR